MRKKNWLKTMLVKVVMVNIFVLIGLAFLGVEMTIAKEEPMKQQENVVEVSRKGIVNSLDGSGLIVISDTTFQYQNKTRFLNQGGFNIGASRLKINDCVEYVSVNGVLTEVKQIDQKDLGLEIPNSGLNVIKNESGTAAPVNSTGQQSPIRTENGVWRN